MNPFELDNKSRIYLNKTMNITKCVPSEIFSLLRHKKFRCLYKWPCFSFMKSIPYKFSYWFYVSSDAISFTEYEKERNDLFQWSGQLQILLDIDLV